MSQNNSQELMSIAECARLLNVHPNTIRNLIIRGEIKAVRIGERVVRIKREDFEQATTPYKGGEYGMWSR